MRRVAILRNQLLPISETFIREQACALREWHPILVGHTEVEGGLTTGGLQREIVRDSRSRLLKGLHLLCALPNRALVNRLEALKIDLVHAHFGVDATDAWLSVRALGLPMVVTLHGYDVNVHRECWEAGRRGAHRRLYPRRLLQMSRDPNVQFVAVSHALRRRAFQIGLPEDKISVAHIGVDTERFRPGARPLDERPRKILFVGRMVEKKAPLMMVRIFREVLAELPDAQLVMIGAGPLLGEAQQLAAHLAVPVTFTGALGPDAVLAHLHEARVFCLPSLTASDGDAEGFGLVLLEAQACGVPVVTSAMGGAQEGLLDGQTGHACREGALTDFVTGLLHFLRDDAAALHASAAAVAFARRTFDIRVCTRQLERIYDTSSTATVHS